MNLEEITKYAPNFLVYLRSLSEDVRAERTSLRDHSYNMDYLREFTISLGDKTIGAFRIYGPKPSEEHPMLEYHGTLPGYVNENVIRQERMLVLPLIVGTALKVRYVSGRVTPSLITLIWSNMTSGFVDDAHLPYLPKGELTSSALAQIEKDHHYRTGRSIPVLINTPWQRQDGHTTIPFP